MSPDPIQFGDLKIDVAALPPGQALVLQALEERLTQGKVGTREFWHSEGLSHPRDFGWAKGQVSHGYLLHLFEKSGLVTREMSVAKRRDAVRSAVRNLGHNLHILSGVYDIMPTIANESLASWHHTSYKLSPLWLQRVGVHRDVWDEPGFGHDPKLLFSVPEREGIGDPPAKGWWRKTKKPEVC
ncbi:MAG: hypothetical protein AB7G06_05720 [Bdellovibrionales bacterium]